MAGWLSTFLFFSNSHIYRVAGQLNHSCFFSFLADEQLHWSSLGSTREGIKSTRTVAESVLLPKRFFSSCVRTENSDLQSTFSLLWSLGSPHSLPHIFHNHDTGVNISPDLYIVSSFPSFSMPFHISHLLSLSFSHTQSSSEFTGTLQTSIKVFSIMHCARV